MLIALVGPSCAGKNTVATYLCEYHGFKLANVAHDRYRFPHSHDAEPASRSIPASSSSSFLVNSSFSSSSSSEDGLHRLSADGTVRDLNFRSTADLLEYSTANWREQLVTVDLALLEDINTGFDKRPWFLLVAIEAPLSVRWKRSNNNNSSSSSRKPTVNGNGMTNNANGHGIASHGSSMEDFVDADDTLMYGTSALSDAGPDHPTRDPLEAHTTASENGQQAGQMVRSGSTTPGVTTLHLGIGDLALQQAPVKSSPSNSTTGLYATILQSHLRILNPYTTKAHLYAYLSKLALPSMERLRPNWETYFLSLCTLASLRSNCMKRRVGAVLVRNNRVLSTGYNGTPRGMRNCNEGGCKRCNASASKGTMLTECFCLHAEENALLECGRETRGSGSALEGTVLYCNTCPCLRCAVKIVQTGVKEVVYQLDYSVDHRSCDIFKEAGVRFRKYDDGTSSSSSSSSSTAAAAATSATTATAP